SEQQWRDYLYPVLGRRVVTYRITRHRRRDECLILLLDWVGFFQIGREPFERGLGQGRRHPWFKPPHDTHLRSLPILNRGLIVRFKIVRDSIVNTHRQPNFRRKDLHRADEALRRDPDNRERAAVDQ